MSGSHSNFSQLNWGRFFSEDYGLVGILVFLLSFLTYVTTLYPTLPPADSGELITAAYLLGIPHGSGYPLYALAAKIFTYLPLGSIAYRVNLSSAFFAAAAVMLVYFILFRLTRRIIPAVVGALILAFSPLFWASGTRADVFPLNSFITTLLLLVLLLFWEKKSWRYLALGLYLFGLGAAHHHTIALLVPLLLYVGFVGLKEAGGRKSFRFPFSLPAGRHGISRFFPWIPSIPLGMNGTGLFFFFLLIGFLLYFYLPLRAQADPYLNWGNPHNWEKFTHVITAGATLTTSSRRIWSNLLIYGQLLWRNFFGFGVLLGLLGMWHEFKLYRERFWFILLAFLFTGVGYTAFIADSRNGSMWGLHILSFVVFSLWVGMGVSLLLAMGYRLADKYKNLTPNIGRPLVVGLILLLPVVPFKVFYPGVNKSNDYFAYDLGVNILNSFKKRAIVFAHREGWQSILWYLQGVEKKRLDVKIISEKESAYKVLKGNPWLIGLDSRAFLTDEEVIAQMRAYRSQARFVKDIADKNIYRFPLYADLPEALDMHFFSQALVPYGVTYRLLEDNKFSSKHKFLRRRPDPWKSYRYRGMFNANLYPDPLTRKIIGAYAQGHADVAAVYWSIGEEELAEIEGNIAQAIYPIRDYPYRKTKAKSIEGCLEAGNALFSQQMYAEALEEFRAVLKLDPRHVVAMNNIGVIYFQWGKKEEAKKIWRQILEINPSFSVTQQNLKEDVLR